MNVLGRGKNGGIMAFHMEGSTEVYCFGFVYSLFAQQHTIIFLTDQVGNNVFGTPASGCECGQVCVFFFC